MRAHDPAAAHCFHRPIEIGFAKRKPREDSLRFRFDLPAAVFVEKMQCFVVFR